jgi:peptidoglycan hydrolase-like protein with peptidoglycan-binding domain
MIRTAAAAVAALVAVCVPAYAADESGNLRIKGFGAKSCEAFVTSVEEEASQIVVYRAWTNGYLTGVNAEADGVYDVVGDLTLDSVMRLALNVCRGNPDTPFIQALGGVAGAVRPLALDQKPQRSVTAEADGSSVSVAEQTLVFVQRRLREGGYYNGALDGLYGPNTRKAIETFQRDTGIATSGLPDQSTLLRLLRGAE